MFISTTHNNLIDNRIKNLEAQNKILEMRVLSLREIVDNLLALQPFAKINTPKKDRKSHNWSEEKRAAQSARMKAKWLEKRAAKEQGAAS